MLKVQVRFVDGFVENSARRMIDSVVGHLMRSTGYTYPFTAEGHVYTLREIASEKLRAMLTRLGVETRGVASILKEIYDLYKMFEVYGLKPSNVEMCARQKIEFILGLEPKYQVREVELPEEYRGDENCSREHLRRLYKLREVLGILPRPTQNPTQPT